MAVFLIVLFCDSAATSIAASPEVAIKTPLNGSVINTHTPSFSGSADGAGGQVTLMLYKGVYAEGTLVQELSTLLVSSGSWSVGPAEMLESGTYTAQASQSGATSKTNRSSTVTFTVSSGSSTPLPTVTLNSPQAPPGDAAPSFTGAASDTTPVEIQIHAGITAKGPVVSRATAAGTGAIWTSSNASPELSVGQYTAVAIQTSLLGGAGRSQPMTFTVTAAPLTTAASFITTPPAASFRWFPSAPHTGEPVSLVSTSTDPGSPITAFAWALTSNSSFQQGGVILATSFPTPGGHAVRLRVTNAYGLSSTATQTIDVAARRAFLMQPFPVVRIVATQTASGVKLRVLKLQQLPPGARIAVRCKGRGCPVKHASRVTLSSRRGVAPVEFRRLERSLRFGITLEVRVSKPGEIGKYTRFAIRRGQLPARVDTCLDQAGAKPLVCPPT